MVHGCPTPKQSLRAYLDTLTKHTHPALGFLIAGEVQHFQKRIISKRNRYMHAAGTFPPSDAEITELLSDMDVCLTRVLGL
jgi:hypothetical protein